MAQCLIQFQSSHTPDDLWHLLPHVPTETTVRAALVPAVTIPVAVIALVGGLGAPYSGPLEIVTINGFFVALFVGSAVLFRKAARHRPHGGMT